MDRDKPPETLELKYIDRSHGTVFASGVIVTKAPGDFFQMSFFADVTVLEPEVLELRSQMEDGGIYAPAGQTKAVPAREVQARVLLTPGTLRKLIKVLQDQLEKKPDAAE